MTKLIEMLLLHEGMKLAPYRCPRGYLTIGVGRNLDNVGITKDEALYLLFNDVTRCRETLERECPWFEKLSDNRQDVIISMAFNMGFRGLLGFKGMIAALEKGDFDAASQEMLKSYWQKQVGQRAKDLAEIMKSDSYPSKLS